MKKTSNLFYLCLIFDLFRVDNTEGDDKKNKDKDKKYDRDQTKKKDPSKIKAIFSSNLEQSIVPEGLSDYIYE